MADAWATGRSPARLLSDGDHSLTVKQTDDSPATPAWPRPRFRGPRSTRRRRRRARPTWWRRLTRLVRSARAPTTSPHDSTPTVHRQRRRGGRDGDAVRHQWDDGAGDGSGGRRGQLDSITSSPLSDGASIALTATARPTLRATPAWRRPGLASRIDTVAAAPGAPDLVAASGQRHVKHRQHQQRRPRRR